MSWPPASDYQDAIQNPATCFQDPELRQGQPALTRLGLPRVASGNFASVYQLQRAPEKWAVRCFLRQGADQNRYALLSQYLSSVRVPGLVEFGYLSQGIRVRGQWLPVVKMDWVDGITLQTYVGRHLHEPARLRSLAVQWQDLLQDLRRNRVAHCDLQHGNVLVTPSEELRLVDYDGMYVPPLKGQPSHELGHPNYQHPLRSATDYSEDLDNFAATVIYTALRALIAEPGLWADFDTGENLLFSAPDYRAPAASPLFLRLHMSPDPAVGALAVRIARACEGTPAGVPGFLSLVDGLPPIAEPVPWWRSAVQEQRQSQSAPKVPPLPQHPPANRPPAEPPNAAEPGEPWWSKRPSTLMNEFRTPDLSVPVRAGEMVLNRVRVAPVRQGPRKGSGCLAALTAGCIFGGMLTVGAGYAVRAIVQELGSLVRQDERVPAPRRGERAAPPAPRTVRPRGVTAPPVKLVPLP